MRRTRRVTPRWPWPPLRAILTCAHHALTTSTAHRYARPHSPKLRPPSPILERALSSSTPALVPILSLLDLTPSIGRRLPTQVAKLLLKFGAELETANKQGWTPLHHAAAYGHADMVRRR